MLDLTARDILAVTFALGAVLFLVMDRAMRWIREEPVKRTDWNVDPDDPLGLNEQEF